jgi:superfamily II DNA or RNA helicase
MVHRQELIAQASKDFTDLGIPHGIIKAGEEERPEHRVQICSVQSVEERRRGYPIPDLVIWDESHHAPAKVWRYLIETFDQARHLVHVEKSLSIIVRIDSLQRLSGISLHIDDD